MIFANPAVLAADEEVVVYGEDFEGQPIEPSTAEAVSEPPKEIVEEPITEELPDDDDDIDIGRILRFDDLNLDEPDDNPPPVESPTIEVPDVNLPKAETPSETPKVETPKTETSVEIPAVKTPIAPLNDDLVDSEPTPIEEPQIENPLIEEPYEDPFKRYENLPRRDNRSSTATPIEEPAVEKQKPAKKKKAKKIKPRFFKLASDDSFDYYLDSSTVQWNLMPYSKTEYMADVWVRMLERSNASSSDMPSDLYDYVNEQASDELEYAAEKGMAYNAIDARVLMSKKYFLEHYYIRPQKRQIQFLCELEGVGRPQNTISERAYDYKNWENLIPGSIETAIYYGVLDVIGTGKANAKGYMTATDMLEEYLRISIR